MWVIIMGESILGTEKVSKLFLNYSITTIGGMLVLGLNTVADGFFVGKYIGANALASVNIAMPFLSLMLAVGVVIGIGSQSIVGRTLGEGKIAEANNAVKTALILILGISTLLAALAVGFTAQIANFLGANELLMPTIVTYLKYSGMFLPVFGLMLVLDYVLKVLGKPLYAMVTLVTSVAGHMMLNWLFIVQLELGIKGAALAAGIAYLLAFVMALIPFIKGNTTLKLLSGRFDKKIASNVIYNGSSEGLAEIGTGVTTFLFNITLMRFVGESGVAAFTAISYLAFIGNNILLGLSDGVGAIISYNYGSGKLARVKQVLQLAVFAAAAIGVGIFTIIANFSKELISIFLDSNSEMGVLSFSITGAKLYAYAFLVNGLNIVASGYFTAIGNPKSSALIAVSRGIVWIVICITLLPAVFGIRGIWLTIPIAEMITIMLSIALMYKHFKRSS